MEIITLFRIGRRWVVSSSETPILRHFENRNAAADFARDAASIASVSVVRELARDGSVERHQYFKEGSAVLEYPAAGAAVSRITSERSLQRGSKEE